MWPALKGEGEGGIWARARACGAREGERKGLGLHDIQSKTFAGNSGREARSRFAGNSFFPEKQTTRKTKCYGGWL